MKQFDVITHQISLEEVDHAVAVVKQDSVQVVRYDVTSVGFGAEVGGDLARKTVDNFVSIVVILVVRITLCTYIYRVAR